MPALDVLPSGLPGPLAGGAGSLCSREVLDAVLFCAIEGAGAVSGALGAFPGAEAGEAAGMHLGFRFNPRITSI